MDLLSLSKSYKRICVTRLVQLDLEIPFKLPTWGEYKRYLSLLERDPFNQVETYEFIFKEIVLNTYIITKIYELPAGLPFPTDGPFDSLRDGPRGLRLSEAKWLSPDTGLLEGSVVLSDPQSFHQKGSACEKLQDLFGLALSIPGFMLESG